MEVAFLIIVLLIIVPVILYSVIHRIRKNILDMVFTEMDSQNAMRQSDKNENIESLNNTIKQVNSMAELAQKRYDCINEKIRVRTIKLQSIELRLKAFEAMTIDRFKNMSEQINGSIDVQIERLPKGKTIIKTDKNGKIATVIKKMDGIVRKRNKNK